MDAPVHWGEVKQAGQKQFLAEARMVVPRLGAGDILVAHSFLAHGTSPNTTDVRRDMIFQRRAATALMDPATQAQARQAFMRDPWTFFRTALEAFRLELKRTAVVQRPVSSRAQRGILNCGHAKIPRCARDDNLRLRIGGDSNVVGKTLEISGRGRPAPAGALP